MGSGGNILTRTHIFLRREKAQMISWKDAHRRIHADITRQRADGPDASPGVPGGMNAGKGGDSRAEAAAGLLAAVGAKLSNSAFPPAGNTTSSEGGWFPGAESASVAARSDPSLDSFCREDCDSRYSDPAEDSRSVNGTGNVDDRNRAEAVQDADRFSLHSHQYQRQRRSLPEGSSLLLAASADQRRDATARGPRPTLNRACLMSSSGGGNSGNGVSRHAREENGRDDTGSSPPWPISAPSTGSSGACSGNGGFRFGFVPGHGPGGGASGGGGGGGIGIPYPRGEHADVSREKGGRWQKRMPRGRGISTTDSPVGMVMRDVPGWSGGGRKTSRDAGVSSSYAQDEAGEMRPSPRWKEATSSSPGATRY